jgi:anti-sigma-K factor RskA
MDYRDPQRRDALAAEYALGTLQGGARRRFERLLAFDADLRRTVERWQESLYPLVDALPERKPPYRVWDAVQRRIRPPVPARSQTGFWDNLVFWRAWGMVAGALALALALALYLAMDITRQPALDYLAVINDNGSRPAWLVQWDRPGQRLVVHTLTPQPLDANRSFELWMLPAGGQPPRSLGLLPAQGSVALALSQTPQDLRAAEGFAVSLEPGGGSPTGQPTGPVLYQGLAIPPV